jgi:hypothetical protein
MVTANGMPKWPVLERHCGRWIVDASTFTAEAGVFKGVTRWL